MDRPLITTPPDAREAGFSLLEMVIVVAVLAVLSVSVGFSAARVSDRRGADAARFAAQFALQRHLAIIGRSVRGVALSAEGWRVMTRAAPNPGADADADAAVWRPEGRMQRFYGEVRIPGLPPQVRPAAANGPDLTFLPDGRVTPVSIAFISAGAITRCATDGWSDLACFTE